MLCLAGKETLARAGLKQKVHLKIIKHTSIRKFKVSPACHVQMSNVSMVELLSERTSRVPPVIFSMGPSIKLVLAIRNSISINNGGCIFFSRISPNHHLQNVTQGKFKFLVKTKKFLIIV